jgi:hypothetical protein
MTVGKGSCLPWDLSRFLTAGQLPPIGVRRYRLATRYEKLATATPSCLGEKINIFDAELDDRFIELL